ncbi:hypothetical protein LWI29_021217 [Acer saccharum]|uniref:Uncharacterized protein n=1 Tax=Acer saccharum TaxID=4024 RepID=A0AA39TFS5_ACESA|nr:hypothetical protein LWI29_021217 [Acer saccharum]
MGVLWAKNVGKASYKDVVGQAASGIAPPQDYEDSEDEDASDDVVIEEPPQFEKRSASSAPTADSKGKGKSSELFTHIYTPGIQSFPKESPTTIMEEVEFEDSTVDLDLRVRCLAKRKGTCRLSQPTFKVLRMITFVDSSSDEEVTDDQGIGANVSASLSKVHSQQAREEIVVTVFVDAFVGESGH